MKALKLCDTPVRVDREGMICLTDMWKASGKSESESPYHYLRNKQTKEFLAELEKNHESVVFTERGVKGGTYGGKFVAYDYAAWLNPGFKYAAYKVLDDYFTGQLQHKNSLSAQLNIKCHEFDQKKDMASFCGSGLASWRFTKPVLLAEIHSLANQLQITIPGLPK
ncbi:UNVERIFIED_ORG: KilA domain-containing protein [Pantoea agglomerans]|uniref:KilA domain-containing protein n=1 Tax=Enterobacter agglomerans TaxID=549 RepID=A0ABD6XLT6_ENTAG|nr:KilA-N domain-containing protein [Pantoea agglomerans]WNK70588.1 KilA-N domain-containing protein [Pantoea agglomerans]